VSSHLGKKIKQKNWESEDIKKTLAALESARRNSGAKHHQVRQALIVVSLLTVGLGNLLIAILLVPLMLALQGIFLYLIVALLGFMMGLLFEILTRSIESLHTDHHILFSLIMPILALISVLFMASLANDAASFFGVRNTHNPYTVGFLYSGAFLLPYAIAKFMFKKQYCSS
jgi:hypothetical protein